jgi:excisionase family DNA binding protein
MSKRPDRQRDEQRKKGRKVTRTRAGTRTATRKTTTIKAKATDNAEAPRSASVESDPTMKTAMLTYGQAAREIGLSERTVHRLVIAGKILARKVGARAVRISRAEVERYIQSAPIKRPDSEPD